MSSEEGSCPQPHTLRRGVLFVSVGVIGGLGVSTFVGRTLSSQLYETTPADPVTLGGSVAVLCGIALLAQLEPLRRAIRVDPVTALKDD